MKIALLLCPFCNGKPKIYTKLYNLCDVEIKCKKCHCSSGNFDISDNRPFELSRNKIAAIKAWNTRYHE